MKIGYISTSAMSQATKLSLSSLQSRLADAQKEVSSGRFADVGQTLGYRAGQSISLRQELSRLNTITDTNATVSTRLDATQGALKSLADSAQSLLGQLISARNGQTAKGIVQGQAASGLAAMGNVMNTSVNGAYLFAGINSDVKPFNDYAQTPASASQQAVGDAFTTAFGVSQSDPAVDGISGADMKTFFDSAFGDLFSDAGWSATWSSASDKNVRSRISTSELIETSANANDPAFRKLASAYTMVADLGVEGLSDDAYQAVIDKAVQATGEAISGLTALQAKLGTAQERGSNANERMAAQVNILTNHVGALEGVDPAEAATRVSSLLTQIETAYAMTARIEQLSLLKYL